MNDRTPTRAAVDVGYGYTKAATPEDGRRVIFPSAVIPNTGGDELAAALGQRRGAGRVSILKAGVEKEEWLVGDEALAVGGRRTWNATAAERDGYAVLVLAALGRLNVRGPLDLTVGLPLSAYLRQGQRDALTEALRGVTAWVSVEGHDAEAIILERVAIAPQGLGALQHHMRSAPANGATMLGIIDVGYRTTDYALCLRKGAGMVPDAARSGSVPQGMGQVMDALRQHVMANSNVTIPPTDAILQMALASGSLRVEGRALPLFTAYKAACLTVARAIESQIARTWDEALPYLGAIVLAGGGGADLAQHFSLPGLELCNDSVWANALGFAGI